MQPFTIARNGNHLFSTYAHFSKKLNFFTPWYAHVRVRIRGLLIFGKFRLCTKYTKFSGWVQNFPKWMSLNGKRLLQKSVNIFDFNITFLEEQLFATCFKLKFREMVLVWKRYYIKIWSHQRWIFFRKEMSFRRHKT